MTNKFLYIVIILLSYSINVQGNWLCAEIVGIPALDSQIHSQEYKDAAIPLMQTITEIKKAKKQEDYWRSCKIAGGVSLALGAGYVLSTRPELYEKIYTHSHAWITKQLTPLADSYGLHLTIGDNITTLINISTKNSVSDLTNDLATISTNIISAAIVNICKCTGLACLCKTMYDCIQTARYSPRESLVNLTKEYTEQINNINNLSLNNIDHTHLARLVTCMQISII